MAECPEKPGAHWSAFREPRAVLDGSELAALIDAAEVIEFKTHGRPSVIRCAEPEGVPLIVKLWHPKRGPSSDLFRPYYRRFVANTATLRARGIRAPTVQGWGRVAPDRIRFVSYDELPGEPLKGDLDTVNLEQTARFVERLHSAGIDFRALHLGNILRDSAGDHSLIDVTDCGFRRGPLPLKRRMKALARFCYHRPERAFFESGRRWSEFVSAYCNAMALDAGQAQRVQAFVGRLFP